MQAAVPLPPIESLVLLGVDDVSGGGVQAVRSKHYACMNCMSTWKLTLRTSGSTPAVTEVWEMIDKPD